MCLRQVLKSTRPRLAQSSLCAIFWSALAVLALGLSSCSAPEPPPQPTVIPNTPLPTSIPLPPAFTATVPSPSPVRTLRDVETAVVRIVMEGAVVEPTGNGIERNPFAGSCSGFLIDPTGLIVTNNHCVTGAGLIKVYMHGSDEAHLAKVRAASECADLAVIEIKGEQMPYLAWYTGEVYAGLSINVAGFPGGDPEYTLTPGQVSKVNASGASAWSSVEARFEHTAETRGGSSGGPTVTLDGQVVGVHFAGNEETRQHFAIRVDEARTVVDLLQKGENYAAIGLNGQAVRSNNGSLSGLWVRSVKSGSPADKAGIRAGDLLTEIEGIKLAKAGTMDEYCNIIRDRTTDVLSMRVWRFGEGQRLAKIEVLEGQINGEPLKQVSELKLQASAPAKPAAGEQPSRVETLNLSDEQVRAAQLQHRQAIQQFRQAFFEDFQNTRSASRWPQGEDTKLARQLERNVYSLTLKQGNSWNGVGWKGGNVGDTYAVELKVLTDDGTRGVGSVGILFGDQGNRTVSVFCLRNDHTWQILSFHNGQIASEYSTAPTPSRFLAPGINANTLWVVRTPERVEFWLNAALVAFGPPEMASGPGLGVVAQSGGNMTAPISADVDDFVVWVPR